MDTVKNACGADIYYSAAVELMDDDIRDELAAAIAPCTNQEFFNAYCIAHVAKYGAEFELAKLNPQY